MKFETMLYEVKDEILTITLKGTSRIYEFLMAQYGFRGLIKIVGNSQVFRLFSKAVSDQLSAIRERAQGFAKIF